MHHRTQVKLELKVKDWCKKELGVCGKVIGGICVMYVIYIIDDWEVGKV